MPSDSNCRFAQLRQMTPKQWRDLKKGYSFITKSDSTCYPSRDFTNWLRIVRGERADVMVHMAVSKKLACFPSMVPFLCGLLYQKLLQSIRCGQERIFFEEFSWSDPRIEAKNVSNSLTWAIQGRHPNNKEWGKKPCFYMK